MKKYETPAMEVLKIETNDIVTTSTGTLNSNTTDNWDGSSWSEWI